MAECRIRIQNHASLNQSQEDIWRSITRTQSIRSETSQAVGIETEYRRGTPVTTDVEIQEKRFLRFFHLTTNLAAMEGAMERLLPPKYFDN